MRIIAGKYKRTPLKTLEGDLTRPTKDMVKEAVFSSIDIDEDTVFLDLFSGSGAIGLEAISRGAKDAVFNDMNRDAVKIIKENLSKLHEERRVFNLDCFTCLEKIKRESFDFIYLDPPYKFTEYESLLKRIQELEILRENGRIIVEVRKDTVLNEKIDQLELYKEKRYGITKLCYYRFIDE